MIKDLNGKWYLKEVDTDKVIEATVPGCNYLDLLDNRIIEDPFYKNNEKKVGWVAEKDWLYFRNFTLTKEEMKADKIYLNLKQVDTICDIFINGNKVQYADNCFVGYEIEVKQFLVEGENSIELYFYSPVKYVLDKQQHEKCPRNANGLTGIAHIRKPACHFGWDWGPILTPSGISGDIYLEFVSTARLINIGLEQIHNDTVSLSVSADIERYCIDELKVIAILTEPNNQQKQEFIVQNDKIKCDFCIDNPILWQPNGYTDRVTQPLYELSLELYSNDILIDSTTRKTGIRTIELNRQKDEYGNNFQFVVNGKPIFCKGANWIPPDSFITRQTKEQIEKYILIAVKSNFNMIRVWGGGYYETDYFYELCDKYGILVWQDFMFACQAYPFFIEEFSQNVYREIEYNVKRLAYHPSLALWCGNNEIEVMSTAWLNRKKYVEWTEKYFYHILPEIVRKFDKVTPYIAGTPIGSSHNKGVGSDKVGDTHLWAVWHGLQKLNYYRTRYTRFCSEFGFESLPDINAIERFCDKSDYSLDGEVFSAHQKCMSGNKKMQFYITSKYRLPERFEDYIYLSQICQSECVKDATEHWRRNKGRCNGSLYWQFNDCWPVCSWASVDYYQNYKALQYDAKKFFSPVIVSIEDNKNGGKVYLINDTDKPFDAFVRVRLVEFAGKNHILYSQNTVIDNTKPMLCYTYDISDLKKLCDIKNAVLVAEIIKDDEIVGTNTVLFGKEKNLRLPKAEIDVSVEKCDDKVIYRLKSDKYVRKLMLHTSISNAPFSDNFFDLLPNEEKTVTQELSVCDIDEIKSSLTLFDISKVVPKNSKFIDFITKSKIFLSPLNFVNYIYYKYLIF